MFRPGLAATSFCFFPQPCFVIVRLLSFLFQREGEGEEEKEGGLLHLGR